MVAKTLRNTADAYTSSAEPNKPHFNKRKLYVKENNPDTRWAYLFFGVPFSPKSKIVEAELGLYNGTTLEGGATVTIGRITEKWAENTLTHNHKPNAVTVTSTTKSGDVAPDTLWTFNITAMLQSVANGAAFFGVRFTCNDGAGEWFHSSTSDPKLRPYIKVKWSEPTGAPTNLEPSGGRAVATQFPVLSFDWEDLDGESDIIAAKVEFSTTQAFTSIAYDTGWYNTSVPEVPTAATGWGGLANNGQIWWRVSARGSDGSESPASDPALLKRVDQGSITILNPSSGGEVTENTPPFIYTATVPLVARQLILFDPADGKTVLYDTGKIPGDAEPIYPDKKLKTGRDYGVRINGWDATQRVRNAGIPPYITAERTFHVQFKNTVSPVTGLASTRVSPWHWAKLTWTRSTAPDYFEIYADDRLIEKVESADVITGATTYEYTCRLLQPRTDVVLKVVAIVNGVGSLTNPTVTVNYKANSVILSELDGTDAVMFLNTGYTQGQAVGYAIHDVLDGPPIPIMQNEDPGERFSFSGVLSGNSVPGVSVAQEIAKFDRLKRNPGRDLLMTRVNKTMQGYIMGANRTVRADGEGLLYDVVFDFYQTDGADE